MNQLLDENLRRRARDGLVGYVRDGVNADRYICLIVSEDPDPVWELRLSYIDRESWDEWTSSDRGWDEVASEMEGWGISWAPEDLNDRILFRAFAFPESGLNREWVVRQRAVRGSRDALGPVVPDSGEVRVALSSEYLHALIMQVVSQHEFFVPQEGTGRLRKRQLEELQRGDWEPLRNVFDLLWETGHSLTVVPLGASVSVGDVQDPWLPFRE